MGNFKRMLMLTGNDAIAKRAGNLDSSAKDLFEDEKRATEKLIREIESKIFDMEDLSVRTTESLIVGENVNLQKWVKDRINLELQKEDLKFELDVIKKLQKQYFTDDDIQFYVDENKGNIDCAIYQMLIIKSEDTTVSVSGLSTTSTSSYFKRLASQYRPNNSGILR